MREAQFNSVDDKFFEVFGVRFLAGRSFDASDFGPGRTPVIVNRSFVTTEVTGRRSRTRWAAASATATRNLPSQRETACPPQRAARRRMA